MLDPLTTLDIPDDPAAHRRWWAFERAAWVVMALVVVAAVLGLFGRGLLQPATAASGDGSLRVEYPRFWRLQSPMQLRVRFSANGGPEARVWMNRAYFESMSLERIVPEPSSVELGPERMTYVFALAPGDGERTVALRVEPERAGRVEGALGVEGGASVRFSHFVYP